MAFPILAAIARMPDSLAVAFGQGAGEIAVNVLFGHDVGAPGRHAPGAVVDRARDAGAVGSAMQIGDPVGLEGIDCPTGWCKHPRHGSAAEG